MSAQEKELALGATFYKEFARSVDNASRLIFPSSFSFKTNLPFRQFKLIYTKHVFKFPHSPIKNFVMKLPQFTLFSFVYWINYLFNRDQLPEAMEGITEYLPEKV